MCAQQPALQMRIGEVCQQLGDTSTAAVVYTAESPPVCSLVSLKPCAACLWECAPGVFGEDTLMTR